MEILKPCPPFTRIAIDYAGPFVVKGTVNARSRKKVWLTVFVCTHTRVLVLLVVDGYDTGSFFLRY